ncbi:ATP-binding protein [Microbacterium gorillae]|uniref:ATP-binding protein n=1 Tax=Microbacterium gorillae TaxID=1231063 RepID=UPI00058BB41A|nr:SbcC/MukB-like Walker B domain-containing protein [Microbacterium gorillae]
MTMLDTLFGLIPAASRGQQWVADELQLVNWGGYDGAHRVRFSPAATLLCGGSGSGKSTLMDAYIALMMPHTTPFNGASNGAVVGKPRGVEQRNILSYGRGKLDESRTAEGTKVRVLRGDGTDTWTAIAMTWLDHDGSRFTAVRAWYIPAAARVVDDTVRVRATIAGPFDLASLESAARDHFADSAVRATGLETMPTDREFSARLHGVLGIGAAGAGAKAMSLLARIQAGQQITTVDDLYKRMVLEEPEALAVADSVVSHFDGLEDTRTRMLTAERQVRTLTPIRDMRVRIEDAAERLRLIDAIGQFADADSLASLWRDERRLTLLREVETELRSRTLAAEAVVREHEALAAATESEVEGLTDLIRAEGGDRLDAARRELRRAEAAATRVRQERDRLADALRVLDARIDTQAEFTALLRAAGDAADDATAAARVRDDWAAAVGTRNAHRSALTAAEVERAAVSERQDNIPQRLRDARDALATAAGLTSEDLPFVAELIEVRTEFEPWRGAFNLALGGFATTLLIDTDDLPAFRAAIDSVRSADRLHYVGARTGLADGPAADPRTLPGRLDHKRSPFTGWLQGQLADRFGFVCVDSAAELAGHRRALTITGQSSEGDRGAHGGHGRANVLGFSTSRRVDELDAQIRSARGALADAEDVVAVAVAAMDSLQERTAAYARVRETTWDQVDLATVEADIARWDTVLGEVAEGNPRITDLQRQIAAKKATATLLREKVGSAKTEQARLAVSWETITDEVDAAVVALESAEESARTLSLDQRAYLDERFDDAGTSAEGAPSEVLKRFDAALSQASRRLIEDQRAAQDTLGEQRDGLRRTLESFLDQWPNPNLLADPDASFLDFERILTDLETSGLHELRTEWRDSLVQLSGNDLTLLDSTLNRSLREIRERIEPINAIMRDLDFYDDDHRLQITPRESQSEVRRRFRKELRAVRALVDTASTPTEREVVYQRMARLIDRIRRSAPDFAELIDVRNHVRVSAERVRADSGEHVALYDHIGEKSGGESQELIAFIVGAALRYQLGDAGSERPRYAPVFLDEALIKADAHFTKRAIGAWRGLGFQLIIGAPNDKYSAIEPHVDVEYDILKDTRGRSWAKPKVGLPAE